MSGAVPVSRSEQQASLLKRVHSVPTAPRGGGRSKRNTRSFTKGAHGNFFRPLGIAPFVFIQGTNHGRASASPRPPPGWQHGDGPSPCCRFYGMEIGASARAWRFPWSRIFRQPVEWRRRRRHSWSMVLLFLRGLPLQAGFSIIDAVSKPAL